MQFVTTAAAAAKSHQSCPTLCDPIDGSSPGSVVPGILQARVLEWLNVAKMVCFFFYLPVYLSLKREILSGDPGIWAVELL